MKVCIIHEVANISVPYVRGLTENNDKVLMLIHKRLNKNISSIIGQNKIKSPNLELVFLETLPIKPRRLGAIIQSFYKVLKFKPDLILVNSLASHLFVAGISCKILNRPLITITHGKDIRDYPAENIKGIIQKLGVKWSDLILLTAKYFFKIARDRGIPSDKLYLIPRYIDVESLENSDPLKVKAINQRYGEVIILAIARLNKAKGLDKLILAFERIAHKFPDVNLLIMGEGGEKHELNRLISENNLQSRARIISKRPHSEISHYINASLVLAHGFVNPGLGIAHYECLSQNVPVITYMKEEQYPGVISAFTINEIADTLSYIVMNPEKVKEMGLLGRNAVLRDFGSKKAVKQLKRYYLIAMKQ